MNKEQRTVKNVEKLPVWACSKSASMPILSLKFCVAKLHKLETGGIHAAIQNMPTGIKRKATQKVTVTFFNMDGNVSGSAGGWE